jgi:putative spermidine/putrescine transport system substrate-binding protein
MGDLFRQLQQWHHPASVATGLQLPIISRAAPIADWVSLGDYWLTAAIQQGLIHPLPEIQGVTEALSTPWQALLQRNQQGALTPSGPLWAVPYRWGSLVLVYARRPFQQLGWAPTHWQDLWRPELAGRVSMPSHPRLALGLMLKGLGESANHPNPDQVPALVDRVGQGRSQVKTYASDDYLQPLLREDTWLAVGWSTDVLPRLEKYRQLAAVVPDPGTLLSADVWVRPNRATALTQLAHQWVNPDSATVSVPRLTELDQQWLSYWLNPAVAEPLQLFAYGASPLLLAAHSEDPVSTSPVSSLLPTVKQRQVSDFLLPLSAASQAIYQTLWQQLGLRP